jgi:hypothetical protein
MPSVCRFEQTLSEFADETNAANQLGKFLHRFVFFGRGNGTCALKLGEIRATRRRLFDFLIPVLVTGMRAAPRLRRGRAFPAQGLGLAGFL